MLRRGQGIGQSGTFRGHVFRRYPVVRHFQRGSAHDDGAPDGVSLGNPFAVKTNDGPGSARSVVCGVQGRGRAGPSSAQAGCFRGGSIPAHRICCRTEFRFRKGLARRRRPKPPA
ncbi:hypothetical protein G6F31_021519 [Rhizopus arrhizus]|nr:hypothetical protein G6F31_021519 [Rhizopus arrhizus]